jgi:hypothetical protein
LGTAYGHTELEIRRADTGFHHLIVHDFLIDAEIERVQDVLPVAIAAATEDPVVKRLTAFCPAVDFFVGADGDPVEELLGVVDR